MSIATRVIDATEPLLARLLAGVRHFERRLGPADDWVEDDRRVLFEAADLVLRPLGRPTTREAGREDYVATVAVDADRVEQLLDDAGYQRNLLSTRKYREHHNGSRQWAVGSWVRDPDDTPRQHHVYCFPALVGGATDIYAHREPNMGDPSAHHGGDGIDHGAPGDLIDIVDARDVGWIRTDWPDA